ncbi:hypothetical protein LUZ62_066853 [Rhynchospora pubera]|uniref:Histidine-containing phosphotransfer protein n=1 Tax=Rhynchospora pubera TaxID=906938 RepID=A0AAV8EUX9_9POAL|nr:hypothetical protein LUZ62_066853 [Rhynchospora pubera]
MEQMLKKYNGMKAALFHAGFLDETFKILEGMRDDKNPEFPFEMLSIFLMNATTMLHDLRRAVTPSTEDVSRADALVHDIKGICLSIGAMRIKNVAETFRLYFLANNIKGLQTYRPDLLYFLWPWEYRCIATAHQLMDEYSLFKQRIDSLMKLSEEIVSAGGKLT